MATVEESAIGARLVRFTEVFLAFLVAAVLALGFGGIIVGLVGSSTVSLFPFVATYVLGYGALGASALAYVRIVQNTNALDLSVPSLLDVRDVLVAFLGVVLAVVLVAAVAAAAGLPVVHAGSVGDPVDSPLLLAAIPLSLFLGVPAQELLFRNACQKRLDERFPTWVAIGVSSLLMVALTLGTFVGAPALGLVVPALAVAIASNAIGLVYARSGTLVSAWLLHGALTVTLLSLLYLDASTALELSSIA